MKRFDRILICVALAGTGNAQVHLAIQKSESLRCWSGLVVCLVAFVYGAYLIYKEATDATNKA